MSISDYEDGYWPGRSVYDNASPTKTGEVMAAIRLDGKNGAAITQLAKHHFSPHDVIGATDKILELRSIPRSTVQGLFNSRGGAGTVEVFKQGRDRSDGLKDFANEVVARQQAEAPVSRRNSWRNDY